MSERWTANTILEALYEHQEQLQALGVVKLGLFGSYVRGEQRPGSDMDFVVVLNPVTLDSYMGTKFYLEDLFNCKVDLVTEDAIKPRIRDRILSETVYVEGYSPVP